MKKVAMQQHEKACVACCSMATFFCFLEKKMVGSRKTCEKLREKTSYKLRAFCSTFALSFFIFAQNFRSNSKSYLLEDLRGAHFCKVPFVAAQYSLHMLISKSSSASSGGSSFCASRSDARKLECLGLPKCTA